MLLLTSEQSDFEGSIEQIKRQLQSASVIRSPIVLDLDGNGVQTLSLAEGAFFDHGGDGFAERSGWVAPGDGLLVWDHDANGLIDSGRELFGAETLLPEGTRAVNGFEALRALDANADGVIDASDPVFAQLRVWVDASADGRSGEGELLTLQQAGVRSINLSYTNSSHVDAQGNAHRQVGSYTTAEGEVRSATDVWVQTNPTQSLPTEWLDVTADIAALPDAQGYGLVRDLHQAMAADASGELQALVQAFTQARTPQERDELLTELIYHWAGVQDVDPTSRASQMIYGNAIGDARRLEALEQFMGQEWVGIWCWGTLDPNPHGRAAPVLLQAWEDLKALVHGQLMAQTQLQGLFQQIGYRWDAELEEVVGDLSGVAQALAQQFEADRDAGLDALGNFLHSLRGMGLLDHLDVDAFRAQLSALGDDVATTMANALQGWAPVVGPTDGNDALRGTSLDDVFDGRGGNDRLFGAGGNDTLKGGVGNDVLNGGSGNDRLDGSSGNDSLDGGSGDDRLEGDQGSDTYRYGRGDGHDTIAEDTWAEGETDHIQLEAGVTANDVRLQRVRTGTAWQMQDNLVLTLRDSGETLTVVNHFDASQRHAVVEFVFADGTVWDADVIQSRVLLGEAEDDDLQGFAGRENTISGGADNDRLQGRDGNDTLDGGTGNDLLQGGAGSDAYHRRPGDGVDRIEEGRDPGNNDVLHLGEGVGPDDVQLRWTAQRDLRVVLPDGGQVLVAQQAVPQDLGAGRGVEAIAFADGTRWDLDEMYARTTQTTDGDEELVLGAQDDVVDGGAGNDRFDNLGGHDMFLFGPGDGNDEIGATRGTLRFKAGVDQHSVRFAQDGTDLVVTLSASGDSVRLKSWSDPWWRVDRFEFDNGTVFGPWEVAALLAAGDETQLLFGSPGDDMLATSGVRATVYAGDGNDRVQGDAARNALYGEAGGDSLTGGMGDDVLEGGDGDDVLEGGAGDDVLEGGEGDDVLEGGAGRDTLLGGAGRNTYVMRRGMGLDTVQAESLATAQDVVVLPEGVRPQDVTLALRPMDALDPLAGGHSALVIGIGQNDALVIEGISTTDVTELAIQTFRFADGTEFLLTGLLALSGQGQLGPQYLGASSPEMVWGSAGEDDIAEWLGHAPTRRVSAGDNDDLVTLGRNDHLVSGGLGHDHIATLGGADTVAGDAGDDHIRTGSQDDVVLFNRGDGHDWVDFGTGTDTLSFGPGIQPDDLSVTITAEGDWLILVDGGAGGSVQVRQPMSDDPGIRHALQLQFVSATGHARTHDFSAWAAEHALALQASSAKAPLAFDGLAFDITHTTAMASGLAAIAHAQTGDLFGAATLERVAPGNGDDWIHVTDSDDTLNAGAGNDHLMGHSGNDVLLGGDGHDVLSGGEGDDALDGGAGNDVLLGGAGSDALWGGGGIDLLKGGMGGDTYRFELGDGQATIEDGHELIEGFGSSAFDDDDAGDRIDDAPNVLLFGEGIRPDDLVFTESGNDLVITFAHSAADRLVLRGFDPGRATFTRSVDVFRFQDGSEIVELDTRNVGVTQLAADDDGDWLVGTPYADRLVGGDGEDYLFGEGGPDHLVGGVGSDTYDVVASTNPLKPTQTLITETWRAQDSNWLIIQGDVMASDLSLALEGDDLVLRIGQRGDSVRFAGFDPRKPGMPAPVHHIELADSRELIEFSALLAQGVHGLDAPPADLVVKVGDGPIDIDVDSASHAAGRLIFSDGIDPVAIQSQLRFEADSNGGHWLVMHYGEANDVLRIAGFNPDAVLDGNHAIDRFEFADGTMWDYQTLVSDGFVIEGDAGSNALMGTNLADRLHGGGGNDALRGGAGDDAYIFERGDGIDTIVDNGATDFNFIRFGAGIRAEDIRHEWDGTTLVLHYSEYDAVRIDNHHGEQGNPVILALALEDGTVLSLTERMNRAPEVANALTEVTTLEDDAFRMVLPADLFSDPDAADELRLAVRLASGEPLPAWLSFDPTSRTLSGRPTNPDVGTVDLVVEARDHFGAQADTALRLRVLNTNDAPEVASPIADQQAARESAFAFTLPGDAFRDLDTGDVLTLTAAQSDGSALPDWMAFDADAHTFSGTPGNPDVGVLTIHVTATDLAGASASQSFALNVTGSSENRSPESQQPLADVLVIKNERSTWQLPTDAFADPDQGDVLSYFTTLANGEPLPDWLVFDAATGSFVATPPANAQGELAVQVTATDTHGASTSQVFELTVGNRGDKPKGNQGVGNGEDPPPPGHSDNFNDGPGTGPGQPGARSKKKDKPSITVTQPTESPLDTTESVSPVDWTAWVNAQNEADEPTVSAASALAVEQHWRQLLTTLQELDAERQDGAGWHHSAAGTGKGLAGLISTGLQEGVPGAHPIGLSGGTGTHLAAFKGIKEGVAALGC
jgi:Ca2+-binding RTX toxin-like protein